MIAVPDITVIPGYDPYRDAEGYRFDEGLASQAINFFADCLTHVKGEWAGSPFVLADYQAPIVANIFGWVREDNGLRRYREVFCYMPRKNGKTSLCAGLSCYIFFCDDEPGAEGYCAAGDREQASITFNIARQMVQAEPLLANQCKIYKGHRAITIEDEGITFKPISADAYNKHGYNSHFVIFDELHTQPNRDLVDVLETSMGSRRQPLMIYITTADIKGESICNEKLAYAKSVRDGTLPDPTFLPVIYEATEDDDWTDPELWARVNPGLGDCLKFEYLERQYKKAVDEPAFENTFKRLHLNMQTGASSGAFSISSWDKCPEVPDRVPDKALCFAGLDLASTMDITALIALYPELDNLVVPYFWVPVEHKEVKRSYARWIQQGFIHTTPGNVTDYDFIRERINLLSKGCRFELAVDPWNSRHLSTQLSEQDGINVVEFRQGYISMNEPTKELSRLIMQGKIGHNGHPVLRWMIDNAEAMTDAAGNIKLSKKHSEGKIDGAIALVMAVGRSMFGDVATSVYETRGLITI